MILLIGSADLVSLISSATGDLDVVSSFMDMTNADPPVVKSSTSGMQLTNITTATTTTIVAAPASTDRRNVEEISIRNAHASTPMDVTVQVNRSAALYEIIKITLPAGSTLEYTQATGWFVIANVLKLDAKLRVTADSVHATAATWADVTGLQCPVESGKHYNFIAHLYHFGNATTTGAQFGIGGVAMTAMRLGGLDVILGSVTAATMGSQVADVTAINTAVMVETTGAATTPVLMNFSGWFQPSASGTWSVRATSEVSVAAGLTIKQGSWCRVWESSN